MAPPAATSSFVTDGFQVCYTARDAILYALSIGFGSRDSEYDLDLRYLYEEHPDFEVVPLFGLSLVFWALERRSTNGTSTMTTTSNIPTFPPPMMKAMGLIPEKLLRTTDSDHDEEVSLEDCPVLHAFHSITWHHGRSFPVPRVESPEVVLEIKGNFCSARPKSIGTFITTGHTVSGATANAASIVPICTLQSTALVLGLPPDQVVPYESRQTPIRSSPKRDDTAEFWFQSNPYHINANQTLWYRLASGDSNRIHVDASSVPMMLQQENDSKPKPLLHGLCTLGLAGRIILQRLHQQGGSVVLHQLEGAFVKPVLVGDSLSVKVWRKKGVTHNETDSCQDQIFFEVYNSNRNEMAVERGYMVAKSVSSRDDRPSEETRSRL